MIDHLWQSTLFAAIVGLLALLLRKNRAQTRYWLWLTASVKFLIPFSLLVVMGSHLDIAGWTPAVDTRPQPRLSGAIEEVFVPSLRAVAVPAGRPTRASAIPALLAAAWMCGFAAVLFSWWRAWWRIRGAVHAASPLDLKVPVEAMSSASILEPAVFGIWRPVLMLPEGITDRLTPAQLEAILAHELCHIRRRDNLFAAVHMAIEAVFWFHPLVWWLGQRIVEERERACDEEVLRLGSEPQAYAEGILKVCEFYLASPLACAAGVTGSNLKKRIGGIMTHRNAKKLEFGKKLLLSAAGMVVVAVPVIVGVVNAPLIRAQSQTATAAAFEVASVKANKSEDRRRGGMQVSPGRFSATNVPLYALITAAYSLPFQSNRLSGGPDWIRSERFDIEAKAAEGAFAGEATNKDRDAKLRLMLQALLADRFKLIIRRDTKELPVYALVVGKNGLKLKKAAIDEKDCPAGDTDRAGACHSFMGGQGRGLHAKAADMGDLVLFVSNWTDRPMVDRTGIKGLYEFETEGWVPLRPRQVLPGAEPSAEDLAMADPSRPTLFSILEQLGLKLESQKAPIEMFVIERVERPGEN
jgi:bla regulator protein BlaR1